MPKTRLTENTTSINSGTVPILNSTKKANPVFSSEESTPPETSDSEENFWLMNIQVTPGVDDNGNSHYTYTLGGVIGINQKMTLNLTRRLRL